MLILGISCFFHDSAACLINNGEIIFASEEERFTRVKHDNNFPYKSIKNCFESSNLNFGDLDYVIFYEKPLIKLDRILDTVKLNYPNSFDLYKEILSNWGQQKLWIREIISDHLKIKKNKILFFEHHFSHAASSFYCSKFSDSDLMTIDGVGEWTTTSFGKVENDFLTRDKSVEFPHSIGLFYSAFTEFLGFEVNDGEYKVMGMAPYGKPKYLDKINKLFSSINGLNFELDMSYFSYDKSKNSNLSNKFLNLFGDKRIKEEPFYLKEFQSDLGDQNIEFSSSILNRSQYFADIAASIQLFIEDLILNFSKNLKKMNNNPNLCYAGGVAYNCAANSKIINNKIYNDIFIQPASGDSGAAIGCALGLDYILNKKRTNKYSHTYLGKSFSNKEIKKYLENKGIDFIYYENFDDVTEFISGEIIREKIIGWFQDSFEFGPRSLGNRSILADPRYFKTKKIVNSKIKFRELFRPFAPSVLDKYAAKYFELDNHTAKLQPYKFMLSTAKVRDEYKEKLEAVTHVDGTSRIQIVTKDLNHKFYNLIEKFGDKSGIYSLLNTSFNRRGEPIVASPEDALATFYWTNIDILVLNNFVIKKIKYIK